MAEIAEEQEGQVQIFMSMGDARSITMGFLTNGKMELDFDED